MALTTGKFDHGQARTFRYRRADPAAKRGPEMMLWCAIGIAACLATFVLPFFFPMKSPVYSPAYTAGGNNRIGALSVACLSLLITAWIWARNKSHASLPAETRLRSSLPQPVFVGCLVLTCLLSTLLGWGIVHSGVYYADAGYFLTQLRTGLIFHKTPYKDFEFAYGPLLYYLPAFAARALSLVQLNPAVAYVVCYVGLQTAGVWLIAFVTSALPLRRGVQIAAFCFVVLCTLNPQAGLNYTAARFLLPVAALVILTRQKRLVPGMIVAGLGVIAQFLVSPELALAYIAGCVAVAVYLAVLRGHRFLLIGVSALAGALLYFLCANPAYFRTMQEFAKGGYNEILAPAPHILALLFCAVVLAPSAVADALLCRLPAAHATEWRRVHNAGMLIGIYVIGLVLLAPALGRCDPLHVWFNGLPLFLLGFVALQSFRTRWRVTGLLAAALFSVYSLGQEYALERGKLAQVLLHAPDPTEDADLPALTRRLLGSRVMIPYDPPMRLVDALVQVKEFAPAYLCIPPADPAAERNLILQMRREPYVLVHRGTDKLGQENRIYNNGLRHWLRFGYRYRARYAPYVQGQLTQRELDLNWRFAGIYGSYLLYQKR